MPAIPSASDKKKFRRPQETGLIIVILLLGLFLTLASDEVTVQGVTQNNFLRLDNLLPNVATTVSWMAIMALGGTFVIIIGGIDISIGSVFGCSALACAAALQYLPEDASAWVVIPIALAVPIGVGLLCGALNGALVVGLKMHPFVVTLGTLSILRGLALISVETKSLPIWGRNLPTAFTSDFIAYEITYAPLAWMKLQPVPMLLMLLCTAAAYVYLHHTTSGRELYAVGGNEEAARFSGLNVKRIKMRVFMLSGLAGGIAGMISAGYYGSANTATGEGYELAVIAAAVVGGASLTGGRGTAFGAMLGAIVIKLIENGIDILKKIDLGIVTIPVSKEYSKIIIGAAIILAVAIDRFSEYLKMSKRREGIKV